MEKKLVLESIFAPSEDVVAREIQGEFLIIPITSGIAESDEEIFTLNETARVVWNNLDGKRTLRALIDKLSVEFDSPAAEIENEVCGFTEELLKRKMLIEVKRG
ncbi:MAG: PqqD family protein [Candidatus Omnitrophota bacterium]|nr:PqqD family protein [Candidatus Omnitrophota bacterium]